MKNRTWYLVFGISHFLALNVQADEGFFSWESLSERELSGWGSGLPETQCGKVRISESEPLYLTALHCLSYEIRDANLSHPKIQSEIKSFRVGNRATNIQRYNFGETPTSLYSMDLVASGGCAIGGSLDLMGQLKESELKEITDCASKDWAIIRQDPRKSVETCSSLTPITPTSVFNKEIKVIGGTKTRGLEINRSRGLKELKGASYSVGKILSPDFYKDEKYPFTSAWSETLIKVFGEALKKGDLAISDADVVPGFSGGPVQHEGNLFGVTTVKLGPQNSGLRDYQYGSHLLIPVQSILKQRPDLRGLFNCNSPGTPINTRPSLRRPLRTHGQEGTRD